MFRRIGIVICLAGLFPCVAYGQTDAEQDKRLDGLEQKLQELTKQLSVLTGNVSTAVEKLEGHDTQILENNNNIAQLNGTVDDLTTQINSEIAKQKQILDAISQADGDGRYVPRLSAAMESTDFRQEMHQAVHDSLDTAGTLSIANKTSQYQRIYVNRQEYGVSAGETVALKVPVGTVTTQVPGRDLKNWTVSAPSYKQNIELVPTTTPTRTYTYMSPPVYVAPPAPVVYYDPWTITSDVVYFWP